MCLRFGSNPRADLLGVRVQSVRDANQIRSFRISTLYSTVRVNFASTLLRWRPAKSDKAAASNVVEKAE